MAFLISSSNTIILGILVIKPCLDTRKAKSQKADFEIKHTIYLIFGQLRGSLLIQDIGNSFTETQT